MGAYSQPTTLEARYVALLKEGTPQNYPKQWSGFAVPIGSVMTEELNVPHNKWQKALTGVSRERHWCLQPRVWQETTGGIFTVSRWSKYRQEVESEIRNHSLGM